MEDSFYKIFRGGKFFAFFSLLVPIFFSLSSYSQNKSPSSQSMTEFKQLLNEYKRFPPEFFNKVDQLKASDLEAMGEPKLEYLSAPVLKARFDQYLGPYRKFAGLEKKLLTEQKELVGRLSATPLSNFKARGDLELKQVALKNQIQNAQFAVFMTSINANMSLKDAQSTVSADRKTLVDSNEKRLKRPKLPGLPEESFEERKRKPEKEKNNLIPVDPEFYETQLGQKLEADLGGRAEFWSYDYENDALYVAQGNEVGKLTVFQDNGGIRFIRSRLGPRFDQVKSPDVKVDMNRSQGKFLTGDKSQETLFGKMPSKAPSLQEEGEPKKQFDPGHSHGDGHDH